MKASENYNKPSFRIVLPLAVAALALLVTGCPDDQYIIQLKPHGQVIQRTLVFYREDGTDTNTGVPNYQPFDEAALAAINSLYPAQGLSNDGPRHVARGEFSHALPNDVGGAGEYTNLTTSLGEAGFYVERFRGTDDLAGMAERRCKAADRLADLVLGWSRAELGRQPGYEKLRQFLDLDFRRDLKNLGAYCWEGQFAGSFRTNAGEELAVRLGQYLLEHGYFTTAEIPRLFRDMSLDESQALARKIQELVARKMGLPETEPAPAALAFLADATMLKNSLDKYLAGTDLYCARLQQWEKDKLLKPDTKKPEPSEIAGEQVEDLIQFDSADNLFGQPDHLAVRLSLPSAPVHSNGKWDESHKEVVWETDIEGRTNSSHVPFFCYANWVQPNQDYQLKHFGKIILTGDDLTQYCLWRNGQTKQEGAQWDAFVGGFNLAAD